MGKLRDRYLTGQNWGGRGQVTRATLDELAFLCEWDADASQAKKSFLRLVATAHTVTVKSADGAPLPESQAAINSLAARAWELGGGGTDKLITALLGRVFTEGGAGIEVELSEDTLDVVDLHPFGRRDFIFERVQDPVTQRWSLAKVPIGTLGESRSTTNPLQTPYQGLDVEGERDPYGTPLPLAALSEIDKLGTFTDDGLAVAHAAGFGRTDISVDHEAIREMRSDLNGEDLTEFMDAELARISSEEGQIAADEGSVHYKYVEYNRVMGADIGSGLDGFRTELVRRVGTALKTIAIILGANEGSTTTHATVQWQIYAKLLEEAQQLIKRLLEAAYNCCLQVWGLPGSCHIEFEPIRQTDRTIEAAADTTEQARWSKLLEDGVIDHDEYAQKTVGHAPARPDQIPPTKHELHELEKMKLEAQLAGVAAIAGPAPTAPAAPGGTQPGADAGLTADEGAALDQATHVPASLFAQWSNAPTIPELGEDAAAILGQKAVADLRAWFQHEAPGLLALLDAEEG